METPEKECLRGRLFRWPGDLPWGCDLGSAVAMPPGPAGGSDRVEVDEDGGPDGLQGRFSGPAVAALAPSVAVDDESGQPLDQRPGALEMVALGEIG